MAQRLSMDDGSLKGIVEHGVTGLLVDPTKCATALPEALSALYEDRALLDQIRKNSRERAFEEFFTWEEKNRLELDELRGLLGRQ